MKRGGGNGGGARSEGALGIGIELLDEKVGGEVREDGRELEYRLSKLGFGSYTRTDGGDVNREVSMVGEQLVSIAGRGMCRQR
jgi:hypothetical protein